MAVQKSEFCIKAFIKISLHAKYFRKVYCCVNFHNSNIKSQYSLATDTIYSYQKAYLILFIYNFFKIYIF